MYVQDRYALLVGHGCESKDLHGPAVTSVHIQSHLSIWWRDAFCEVSPLRVTPLQAPSLMPDGYALLVNIKMITSADCVVRDYCVFN
jgi:hypothetical protein